MDSAKRMIEKMNQTLLIRASGCENRRTEVRISPPGAQPGAASHLFGRSTALREVLQKHDNAKRVNITQRGNT